MESAKTSGASSCCCCCFWESAIATTISLADVTTRRGEARNGDDEPTLRGEVGCLSLGKMGSESRRFRKNGAAAAVASGDSGSSGKEDGSVRRRACGAEFSS